MAWCVCGRHYCSASEAVLDVFAGRGHMHTAVLADCFSCCAPLCCCSAGLRRHHQLHHSHLEGTGVTVDREMYNQPVADKCNMRHKVEVMTAATEPLRKCNIAGCRRGPAGSRGVTAFGTHGLARKVYCCQSHISWVVACVLSSSAAASSVPCLGQHIMVASAGCWQYMMCN